jgi:hypothetical protein
MNAAANSLSAAEEVTAPMTELLERIGPLRDEMFASPR